MERTFAFTAAQSRFAAAAQLALVGDRAAA
jgi:hypothetical protein